MPKCAHRDNKERLQNFSCTPDNCPRFEDSEVWCEKVDRCSYLKWDSRRIRKGQVVEFAPGLSIGLQCNCENNIKEGRVNE
jgi:hypothetical protein